MPKCFKCGIAKDSIRILPICADCKDGIGVSQSCSSGGCGSGPLGRSPVVEMAGKVGTGGYSIDQVEKAFRAGFDCGWSDRHTKPDIDNSPPNINFHWGVWKGVFCGYY